MKLTASDNFQFSCATKNGTFHINSTKNDALFSVFTAADRDTNTTGSLLTWPGEYEFGGVVIQLFQLKNKKLGAKFVAENVRMVFLPAIESEMNESDMEILGDVDLLVLEIDDKNPPMKKMVEEIDPKAVIPVGSEREKFLVNMGASEPELTGEYIFSSSSLPVDKTIFVKLES